MNIIPKGNAHTNSSSRDGHVPFVIVDHISAGTMASMDAWFTSPGNEVSSAHFGVSKTGEIHQYVTLDRMAWANGLTVDVMAKATAPIFRQLAPVNPNKYSVSIEHEGSDGELTEAQFAASVWLHRFIAAEVKRLYGQALPLDERHVIGHFQVDPVRKPFCPGPKFPWTRLYQALRGEEPAMDNNPTAQNSNAINEQRLKAVEARCAELNGQVQSLKAQLLAVQNIGKSTPVPEWAKDAFAHYSAFIHEPSGTADFWRLLTVMYRAQAARATAPDNEVKLPGGPV
ncbi:N-acetylmuramoyl-L-alanine amidase [Gorillibacterium sp. sgz500922]|uniref:N-acetylmuramoyl-L-alanine amidase n=1 Tax=Gorillibacterium sp. sgz500922 TaxID=3446694 RepID=UPI003F6777F5